MLADGSDADIVGCAVLDIETAKCVQKVTVLVSRKLYEDCLIGVRLLTQLGAKIDLSTGLLRVRSEKCCGDVGRCCWEVGMF